MNSQTQFFSIAAFIFIIIASSFTGAYILRQNLNEQLEKTSSKKMTPLNKPSTHISKNEASSSADLKLTSETPTANQILTSPNQKTIYIKQTPQPAPTPIVIYQDSNNQAPTTTPVPRSTPKPPATTCTTLNGRMYPAADGTGYIGCDVKVDGAIDTSQSYCKGGETGQTKSLIPDGYGQIDQYYATLTDLKLDEKVEVYVKSTNGSLIHCTPDLN